MYTYCAQRTTGFFFLNNRPWYLQSRTVDLRTTIIYDCNENKYATALDDDVTHTIMVVTKKITIIIKTLHKRASVCTMSTEISYRRQ